MSGDMEMISLSAATSHRVVKYLAKGGRKYVKWSHIKILNNLANTGPNEGGGHGSNHTSIHGKL